MERVSYETMTIQDLLNYHARDELNISPWYQRRSVWTRPQKGYLVNTILEHKPIPSLYIRHSLDLQREASIREVVDGQQRIRAILEYIDGQFPTRHPDHARPVNYAELSSIQKRTFRMTSLGIAYLLAATDEDVIEIFGRLNSVSKTLNPQEKRNARFSGEFKQFCLKQATSRLPVWRSLNIFGANDIARMAEVQFTSELVINMMDGLRDYSVAGIDSYYKKYDESFPKADIIRPRLDSAFSIVASLNPSAISDTIFHRAPLFFSLLLTLDQIRKKPSLSRLEGALHEIDERFNSDIPVNERRRNDADFYIACKSNPHRIRSRRIRATYIAGHFD